MAKEIKELKFILSQIDNRAVILMKYFTDGSNDFSSFDNYPKCRNYVTDNYKGSKINSSFKDLYKNDEDELKRIISEG